MGRLDNMLLNNQWVKGEIKRDIQKYLVANENGKVTYQNLVSAAEAVVRGGGSCGKCLPQEMRRVSS